MKKITLLGKQLDKKEQAKVNGGLPDNCWCIPVSQAGPCWHIYWNKPCGVPGNYVICNEGSPCGGDLD